MPSILYIEDDPEIGSWLSEDLTKRGYTVQWLKNGDGAVELVARADVVILDVMLPGLDGFTVGQRMKKSAPNTPILMLSARTTVDDKLQGLQFADDYVTKPFHPDELCARIEVLLRRSGHALAQTVKLQHLTVDLAGQQIVNDLTGEEIMLTGKQLHIFMYMLKHAKQILTKEQIYEAVWGEPYLEGDKTVNVHIRYLREKIEIDPGQPAVIETIRGIGYRIRL